MTALLLTATIAPAADVPQHTQFNAEERLEEYLQALEFYLTAPGPSYKILFVDNSDQPLGRFQEMVDRHRRDDRPVHMLSYPADVPPAYGKGRGEMALIERALAHFSDVIGVDEPVWKVTGRLRVLNIGRMIETQPEDFAVYADFRDVPLIGDRLGANKWTDCKLICFTPNGYKKIIQIDWPNGVFSVERIIFHNLKPKLGRGSGIVPRFRMQPQFLGTSGGSGKNYSSKADRAKTHFRTMGRRVAPWLWL